MPTRAKVQNKINIKKKTVYNQNIIKNNELQYSQTVPNYSQNYEYYYHIPYFIFIIYYVIQRIILKIMTLFRIQNSRLKIRNTNFIYSNIYFF